MTDVTPPVVVFAAGAIRLDRRGRFFYGDQEVSHPRVLRMLRLGLTELGDGRYGYKLGPRSVEVSVEDVPYHIEALRDLEGRLSALLTNEREESITAERLVYKGDVPYLRLESGGEACFLPGAALALASYLDFDDDGGCYLCFGDRRAPIEIR